MLNVCVGLSNSWTGLVWLNYDGSRGRGFEPVKVDEAPIINTDRSKAILLSLFFYVTCYNCMYMVFSNMVN